jgi:hypothetical protein
MGYVAKHMTKAEYISDLVQSKYEESESIILANWKDEMFDPRTFYEQQMGAGFTKFKKQYIFIDREKLKLCNYKLTLLQDMQPNQRPRQLLTKSHGSIILAEAQASACSRKVLTEFDLNQIIFTHWLRNEANKPNEANRFISLHINNKARFMQKVSKYRSPDAYCHRKIQEFVSMIMRMKADKIRRDHKLEWGPDTYDDLHIFESQLFDKGAEALEKVGDEMNIFNTHIGAVITLLQQSTQVEKILNRISQFVQIRSALVTQDISIATSK